MWEASLEFGTDNVLPIWVRGPISESTVFGSTRVVANRIGREVLSRPVPSRIGEEPIGSNPFRVTPVFVDFLPVGLPLERGTVSDFSVSGSTRWCADLGGRLESSP